MPARARPDALARVRAATQHGAAGPPFALPRWLDTLSDRWWALTPRTRAVLTGCLLLAAVGAAAARAAVAPHAPPTTVLVATRDLPAGHDLAPGDVAPRRWPAELTPPSATDAAAGILRAPLPQGSPLTDQHLSTDGLAGLVAAGEAAVPIPRDLVPGVEVGVTVSVVTVDQDGRGVLLAETARVVATDRDSLWVAVHAAAAAELTAATLRGTVGLVVLPP